MARKTIGMAMTTTALSGSFIRTPIERAMGRLMRAPDHDPAGDPPAADPATPATDPVDPAAPAADPEGGDPAADPEGSVLGGGAPGDPAEPAPPVVPDAYELTVPEGFVLDPESLEAATPVFRELGLDNERANKLMPPLAEFANRIARDAGAAVLAQHKIEEAQAAQVQFRENVENAKGDAEIGGAKWGETQTLVAKAFDMAGFPVGHAFRARLAANMKEDPDMIRLMRRIGERVSEDSFARAEGLPAGKRDRLAESYPNDVPKT